MRVALHNSTLTRASAVPANRRGVARTRAIRKPSAARWPACNTYTALEYSQDATTCIAANGYTASVGGGVTDTARDKASRYNGGEPKTWNRAGGAGANRPSISSNKVNSHSPDYTARGYGGCVPRFSISRSVA